MVLCFFFSFILFSALRAGPFRPLCRDARSYSEMDCKVTAFPQQIKIFHAHLFKNIAFCQLFCPNLAPGAPFLTCLCRQCAVSCGRGAGVALAWIGLSSASCFCLLPACCLVPPAQPLPLPSARAARLASGPSKLPQCEEKRHEPGGKSAGKVQILHRNAKNQPFLASVSHYIIIFAT